MKVLTVLRLIVVMAIIPVAALSQLAYTAKSVHVRAGPAREYPVVAILQPGVAVTVFGCLSDYSWCDVDAGVGRGWVYAKNILYPHQGANVPVLNYGAVIGIGIIGFSLGTYWPNYYLDRPWYRQMPNWSHRLHKPPPGPHSGVPLPAPQPAPGAGPHRPPPRPHPGAAPHRPPAKKDR